MTLGEYLKFKRKKLGWTQPEAAEKIQTEQSYLSKLESGKCYPSENMFDRLIEVYDIDIETLGTQIHSKEYEKLSEIKQMRELMISKKKNEISAFRNWLVAGLIFMMLSGACLAITHLYGSAQMEYFYRSQGELKTGEPLQAFSILNETISNDDLANLNKKQQMIDRINQVDIISTVFKGDSYVENTQNGKRFYELVSQGEVSQKGIFNWFIVPGLMFFFGGIACFFISYRWK